jgi:hypothetical protein
MEFDKGQCGPKLRPFHSPGRDEFMNAPASINRWLPKVGQASSLSEKRRKGARFVFLLPSPL